MKNVMVDLETVGTRAGCGILSIGAVAFDAQTGTLGPDFYVVVNADSCLQAGLHTDAETLAWWERRDVGARGVLELARSQETSMPLSAALLGFNEYLNQFGHDEVCLWGNGVDFDNAILASAYLAVRMCAGWNFRNNRCFRTLKNLAPQVPLERTGTHHNALDDAKTQAAHAIKCLQWIGRA